MNEEDDLFASGADVLVNPVNAVGTMGKGLALLFRDRFPANNRLYQAACRSGEMRAGGVVMGPGEANAGGPRWVANLATKDHWRNPSQLAWVESGILALRRWVDDHPEHNIRTIACPALGSGLGGLDWRQVAPAIERAFVDSSVNLKLYPPKDAHAARRGLSSLKDAGPGLVTSASRDAGHADLEASVQPATAKLDCGLQEVIVRIGDIVPHEKPRSSVVQTMVRHLRSGGELDPIEIDWRWEKHWTQGPREMECIGTGYGLIDGHHRLEALRIFHGANGAIKAKAKRQLNQAAATKSVLGANSTPDPKLAAVDRDGPPQRSVGFKRLSKP